MAPLFKKEPKRNPHLENYPFVLFVFEGLRVCAFGLRKPDDGKKLQASQELHDGVVLLCCLLVI